MLWESSCSPKGPRRSLFAPPARAGLGERTIDDAWVFMQNLKGRLANRVQLTTDGYAPYWTAVGLTFGQEIDFAQLQKLYGPDPNVAGTTRYSPPHLHWDQDSHPAW